MISSGIKQILIGKFIAPFGIKGWLKIRSYTMPADQITTYKPWLIGSELMTCTPKEIQHHSNGYIVKLPGVDNRDHADLLRDKEISMTVNQLKPLLDGEYYWLQLQGLKAININGDELGTVKRLLATAANDVLVVENGKDVRLIPYIIDKYVIEINLDEAYIKLMWELDW